jgi:hypothetical protein
VKPSGTDLDLPKTRLHMVKRIRANEFIEIDGADQRYLRIENTLTDENGDDVWLEKRARVEAAVTAEPKS